MAMSQEQGRFDSPRILCADRIMAKNGQRAARLWLSGPQLFCQSVLANKRESDRLEVASFEVRVCVCLPVLIYPLEQTKEGRRLAVQCCEKRESRHSIVLYYS